VIFGQSQLDFTSDTFSPLCDTSAHETRNKVKNNKIKRFI